MTVNKKTITIEIDVDLNDSAQEIAAFSKKLRDIQQASKLSDTALASLQEEAAKMAGEGKRSQQVFDALSAALKAFQSQATLGGTTYRGLASAIDTVADSARRLKAGLSTGGFSLGSLGTDLARVKQEMLELDQSTTSGRNAFAQKSLVANQLSKQLDQLSNSYRTVAGSATAASNATRKPFYGEGISSLDASLRGRQQQRGPNGQLLFTNQQGVFTDAAGNIIASDLPPLRRGGRGGGPGGGGGGRRNEFALGQTAGVLAGASIYGGVAGFAGGAIGAVAGPGGALIGAQIGAQVGMLQQAAGGAATYAAEINKLQIALRNVAGSEQAYGESLRAVDSVVRTLNITRLEATRGFTQLSAAVIGAGGDVKDAELVFKNITAAIKATGGNSQDAEGALRALSQTFSKGKVSAEELRGQLGERLPGAVTLFAESIGVTGGELDKMLENGEVGLNDLMKFIEELGTRYSATALKIAASQEEAGARMAVALTDLQQELGKLFAPFGAEYQEAVSGLAKEVTELIKEAKPAIELLSQISAGVRNLTGQFPALGDAIRDSVITMIPGLREMARVLAVVRGLSAADANLSGAAYGNTGVAQRDTSGTGGRGVPPGSARTDRPGWDRTGDDDAKSKADKAAKEALRIAKEEERVREQNAANERKMDETLAKNRIKLADEVFKHKMELTRQEFDLRRRLQQGERDITIANMVGAAAQGASAVNALLQKFSGFEDELRSLTEELQQEQQRLKSVKEMEKVRDAAYASGAMSAFQPGSFNGGGSAKFGSTGNVRNAPGWVHGHFQTNTGSLAQLISDTAPVVMALIRAGVPAELANGVKFRPGMSVDDVKNLLYQGARLHGHSGDGRSVDVFVPEGTPFPFPLADVRGPSGRGGVTGVLPGSGHVWVGHLDPSSRSGGGRLQPGVAAGQRRLADSEGDVASTEERIKAINNQIKTLQESQSISADQAIRMFTAENTKAMRENLQGTEDSIQALRERNRLTMEGVRPEVIDFEEKRNALLREEARLAQGLQEFLDRSVSDKNSEEYKNGQKAINETLAQRNKLTEQAIGLEKQLMEIRAQERDPKMIIQKEILAIRERSDELNNYGNQAKQVADFTSQAFGQATASIVTGASTVKEALAQMFASLAQSFAQMAADIIANQLKMLILKTALGPLMGGGSAIPGIANSAITDAGFSMGASLAGGFAKGGAFASNGIQPFARGGIVSEPTLFKFANGGALRTGLMGEAGPEGILPLRRGRGGRLGVEASGSGAVNITVNVDASGTSASGDSGRAGQLAREIGQAVDERILQLKRPGGLLSATR